MALLEVDSLVVRYGPISALKGVDMRINAGEAVTVIGANGAGKSTLLAAITGTVPIVSGAVAFDGEEIGGMAPEQIARRGIALVPEGRRIWGSLSVAENLSLGSTVRSDRDQIEADLARVLERFPILETYYRTPAAKLSGGEQQQLAIGRALLSAPRLLVLDEPSFGLAPKTVDAMFEILQSLRDSGVTILLIEQNAVRAIEFAERGYLLVNGEVRQEGVRDDFRKQERSLADAYLGRSQP